VLLQNAISPLLLIVITRVNGIDDSGLFSLAFSVSIILWSLAMWGGRTYQVLGVPLKGSTPLRTFGPRGDEIKEFLDNNPCDQYAIVDDVDEFLVEQRPNLVLTEETEGLSYKDYVRLREILELDTKVS
jgi:hypothetical protein